MNTQWPLCCPCSKSWQVSEAGGFLCIRGGQQQWEFVPGAAPQWWIAGPFLWHCWQGTFILTCPYQLTRGRHTKKTYFLYISFLSGVFLTTLLCTFCLPVVTEWTVLHSLLESVEVLTHSCRLSLPACAAAVVSVLLTLCRWSLFVTVTNSSFVPKKRTAHTCFQIVPSVKSWCLKLFWILL